MLLLTIFLRHDQSQTLDEIQARLKQTGFYESFPPPGVEPSVATDRATLQFRKYYHDVLRGSAA